MTAGRRRTDMPLKSIGEILFQLGHHQLSARGLNLTNGAGATLGTVTGGSGSPEGSETAKPGSIYLDFTNGALYVKQSGTDNTGWAEAGSGGGATGVLTVSKNFTNADIIATNLASLGGDETPIEILPAPPAGYVYRLLQAGLYTPARDSVLGLNDQQADASLYLTYADAVTLQYNSYSPSYFASTTEGCDFIAVIDGYYSGRFEFSDPDGAASINSALVLKQFNSTGTFVDSDPAGAAADTTPWCFTVQYTLLPYAGE